MKKYILLGLPLSLISVLTLSIAGLAQQPTKNKIEAPFSVTGGSTKGEITPNVDPVKRNVNFVSINPGVATGKTWVIIPGWNDGSAQDPSGTSNPRNLKALAEKVAKEHPNDRVLMLDWTQASVNNKNDNFRDAPGNQTAATWIEPVAKAAVEKLKSMGITGAELNLIGHSLGSILSAEIGSEYKKTQGLDGKGVNSIVAEPPATTVLSGYVVNGESGSKPPTPFKDAANYSISFYGQNKGIISSDVSISANPKLASTADNSFLINFPIEIDPSQIHRDVIKVFSNLIKDGGNLGFSLDKIDDKFNYVSGGITKKDSASRNDWRLPDGDKTKDEGTIDVSWIDSTPNKVNFIDPITNKPFSKTGKTDPYVAKLPKPIDNRPKITDGISAFNSCATQYNASHIGSAGCYFPSSISGTFVAADKPVQNEVNKQRPESIQAANTYTNGTIVKAPLDIGLTWNQSTKLDLDSHTVTPNGEHVYFSERGSLNNAPNTFLYRDSIPAAGSLGAEQTRITSFQEGEYRFYVYNFSDQQNLAPAGLSNSAAKVQIFQGGAPLTDIPNDPNTFDLNNPALQKVGQPYPGQNTFNVPTGQSGNTWYVFKLDTRTGILTRVNRFGNVDSSVNVPKFR